MKKYIIVTKRSDVKHLIESDPMTKEKAEFWLKKFKSAMPDFEHKIVEARAKDDK